MKITVAQYIHDEMVKLENEKTRESSKRFFKEAVKVHGVLSSVSKEIWKTVKEMAKPLSKDEVFANCEELFKSGFCEEGWMAANLAYEKRNEYIEKDMDVFEKWVSEYVDDLAKCDTLCNHTIASLVDKYPKLISRLKRWAHSPNRWVKRAAAVTLIIPAREGRYLSDIFEIADTMLLDSDDMVQKGYGWMLKAASQCHQKEVFDYVMKNKAVMPRTALRYAIEKMPKELKTKAVGK
ncbi:DNA alkylation repair protein [Candidatus Shapirobacteria bacterium]|nr:DNA alkylation repair protein [Candidatus Shapirobacteria bacterium]